jgi:hypothetical protein
VASEDAGGGVFATKSNAALLIASSPSPMSAWRVISARTRFVSEYLLVYAGRQ